MKAEWLPREIHRELREKFLYLEECPVGGRRLFLNNAAGSLRLAGVAKRQRQLAALPDYPSCQSPAGRHLLEAVERGKDDLRLLLGLKGGQVVQDLTASRLLFSLIRAAAQASRGTNLVTTGLDHPASLEGVKVHASALGKSVRVAPVDRERHTVAADKLLTMVDKDTALLSMTCTSNSTGAVLPVAEIAREAKRINPELFIILDGVQRVPHGPLNLEGVPVDGVVVAPYKMFSFRGSGLGWLSPRLAATSHESLPGQDPDCWDLGSMEPVTYGCFSQVVDYFAWLGGRFARGNRQTLVREGLERIAAQEQALLQVLVHGRGDVPGLCQIPGVEMVFHPASPQERDLIVSIRLDGFSGEEALEAFGEKGVVLSLRKRDSVYCRAVLDAYNLDYVLRISPMHYHNGEEMERFLGVAGEIAGSRRVNS